MKAIAMLGASIALFAVVGCGSSAMPPAKVTETQSAISAAEAVGADTHPQGALHLKLARDQMAQAQSLLRDGKDEEARLVLDRARVDAELALVLTRELKMRAEAQQALEQVNQLQQRRN